MTFLLLRSGMGHQGAVGEVPAGLSPALPHLALPARAPLYHCQYEWGIRVDLYSEYIMFGWARLNLPLDPIFPTVVSVPTSAAERAAKSVSKFLGPPIRIDSTAAIVPPSEIHIAGLVRDATWLCVSSTFELALSKARTRTDPKPVSGTLELLNPLSADPKR
jgi:hypothetical protein